MCGAGLGRVPTWHSVRAKSYLIEGAGSHLCVERINEGESPGELHWDAQTATEPLRAAAQGVFVWLALLGRHSLHNCLPSLFILLLLPSLLLVGLSRQTGMDSTQLDARIDRALSLFKQSAICSPPHFTFST